MSFIQFESARDKDKARHELREAREQMLQQAKERAEIRAEQGAQKQLTGEVDWMLPAVVNKLEKLRKAGSSKKSSKKKKDKSKKSKKSKSGKKKKKRSRKKSNSNSSDSDTDSDSSLSGNSSSTEEEKQRKRKSKKSKKSKKLKKQSKTTEGGEESNTEADEWVERPAAEVQLHKSHRDSWMTDESIMFKTYTPELKETKKPNERQQQEHIDAYDPSKSTRELNPYWKLTGTGLPTFKKPKIDDDDDDDDDDNNGKHNSKQVYKATPGTTRNWQKKLPNQNVTETITRPQQETAKAEAVRLQTSSSSSCAESDQEQSRPAKQSATESKTKIKDFMTDNEINQLAAQAMRAEIKGNTKLAADLNEQLAQARKARAAFKETHKAAATNEPKDAKKVQQKKAKADAGAGATDVSDDDHILLTHTDERGNVRPLAQTRPSQSQVDPRDLYGGRKGKKHSKSKKRMETHEHGERVRYFADDDRYDIKQMFEREKYTSAAQSNLQFADIAAKHKNPNDDLEDIFADKVRKHVSQSETDKKEMERAIHEQQKLNAKLENCDRCFQSSKIDKRLIVSMGEKVYLSLPWHVGLQTGHCVLVPTQHVTCSTQLDEDTWSELNDFRKALTRMFAAQHKDVVFYEIANKLHRRPHLSIHCIPIPEAKAELAPFYFKKAIEESEHEWSVNKQLVSLRHKSLRAAIPAGLPYFWVNFGMENGFAHVIEDQNCFPSNFAQEIIGGMLQLSSSSWRKPQKEQQAIAKVKIFADWWKKYDCTQ